MQSIYEQEYCFLEYEYEKYLVEETLNRNMILNNIQVTSALIESADITAINEAAVDAVKDAVTKVINLIKNLWNKFVERISELVTSGDSYLEKYKETIEKNPFKSRTLEDYYEYDVDNGNLFKKYNDMSLAGDFDTMMKAADEAAAKKVFIDSRLSGAKVESDNTSVKQIIIDTFKGPSINVDMARLDKNAIFNYCANYKKNTLPEIRKLIGNIENDRTAFESKISTLLQGLKDVAATEKQTKDDGTQETDAELTARKTDMVNQLKTKVENESATYISEFTASKPKDNTAPTDKNRTAEIGAKAGSYADANKDKITGSKADADQATNEITRVQTNSKVFFMCLGDVASGKMQVAIDAYKQNMNVLKLHVRDYTGTEGKDTTK